MIQGRFTRRRRAAATAKHGLYYFRIFNSEIIQVLREVGKTIDSIDDIDETATQDSVEFSL